MEKRFKQPNVRISQVLKDQNIGEKVRGCCTRGLKQTCPHCGAVNQKPIFCGDHTHCPVCARQLAVAEGAKLYYRLLECHTDYVGHLVLTVPHEEEQKDFDSEEKEAFALRLFALSRAFLRTVGVSGAVVSLHTWASAAPLGVPHWHVHILFPTNQGWRPVEAWQRVWRDLLQGAQIYVPPQGCDIYYRYAPRSRENLLRHWANYAVRRAVLDINKALLAGQAFDLDAYIYHVLWRKNWRRVRWVGCLSDGNVGKYVDMAAVRARVLQDRIESKAVYCRECHEEISFAKVDAEPLDPALLFVVRDSWRRYA